MHIYAVFSNFSAPFNLRYKSFTLTNTGDRTAMIKLEIKYFSGGQQPQQLEWLSYFNFDHFSLR